MTRARDIASATTPNANAALLATFPHKNLIINGSMICSQRGSSHTTNGYGSLDRYYLALSGATATMSQEAFSASDRNSLGFEKYLKLAVSTANNNCGIFHKIEAQNCLHLIGQKATLSFYAKGTNPAGGSFTIQPQWYNNSSGGGDNGVAQSLTITSSWVKYSFTFDIPAPANTVIDSNAQLSISIIQTAGDTSTTAWELNLAGLQFEAGETETAFEHEDFGTTLAKCQRFYQSMDYYFSSGSTGVNPYYYTPLCFPITMRATPSMTASQWGQNTGNASTYHSSTLVNGWILVSAVSTACIVRGNHTNTYNLMAGRGKFDAEL